MTNVQVCDVHFPLVLKKPPQSRSHDNGLRLSSRVGGVRTVLRAGHSRKLLGGTSANMSAEAMTDERRVLRLRNYQSTSEFSFIPELVAATGKERVAEFLRSSATLPARPRRELDEVGARLRPFGYSLREWSLSPDLAKENVFAPWEFKL